MQPEYQPAPSPEPRPAGRARALTDASAPVVVVGGGWAGLAAATELSRCRIPVILLEAARQLGGRARRVRFNGTSVDNGQHLLIGAYRDTLALLCEVGVDVDSQLTRTPLRLAMHAPDGDGLRLSAPRLPAPLHIAYGLLTARGLSARERYRALAMCLRLFATGFRLQEDETLAALLTRLGQSERLVRILWAPLCLATLNTPPAQASAQLFLTVLRDAFTQATTDSDLVFTAADLGALLPDPALDYVERRGGSMRLGQRVSALAVTEAGVRGVYVDETLVPAGHVVLAIPPHAAVPLLSPHPALRPLAASLQRFRYAPICTVYLQYPPEVSLESEMLGLAHDGYGQWVFDRRACGQPGLLAVVISGPGEHMGLDNPTLIARVTAELARLFPGWPQPLDGRVIREKRATFLSTPGIDATRPGHASPVPGLWLAGDHTTTGYPATLEGAVRSGLQCARSIAHTVSQRT